MDPLLRIWRLNHRWAHQSTSWGSREYGSKVTEEGWMYCSERGQWISKARHMITWIRCWDGADSSLNHRLALYIGFSFFLWVVGGDNTTLKYSNLKPDHVHHHKLSGHRETDWCDMKWSCFHRPALGDHRLNDKAELPSSDILLSVCLSVCLGLLTTCFTPINREKGADFMGMCW